MTPLRIGNRTARWLWLASQGLGRAPTGPLDLAATVRELGFVQLDSIRVVARAHHHILWSRNQHYREPMLGRLLARDRQVFEHFTHDASVIPMQFLPMWRRQFDRMRRRIETAGWFRGLPDAAGRAAIKDRIRAEGALSTHDFDTRIDGPRQMWSRPPHKLALDYMWYGGELATCHRVNFTKYYDLAERVFPAELRDARLDAHAQVDWLCHAALDRMGFGTLGEVRKFWDAADVAEVAAWAEGAARHLRPVAVETAQGGWVRGVAPADIEDRLAVLTPPTARLRVLNPFDPVIRDRTRLNRLFGFDYRVEMFVPAARRVWGYYVYPILEGDRFVGRIELKADRRESVLAVLNFWPEPGVRWGAARHGRLRAELARMARFVGAERLEGLP
ncbi:winged helix-turn-helix domain-containing protein [Rhodobacteraceae bacterium 2CG4]|uniref:Winged helix-turn-helix domain-containing protein n=1 Tax=Halovulum marinum TaxID=2662447 RepID=A0A6L5Z8D7_9RHOB|nr:crosslink repair DNA glycosylase YcaQ family protein [Halovulum marinum]MSU92275.1 winged helix-turn-helix domain-containing protein [Halovulum marinum]